MKNGGKFAQKKCIPTKSIKKSNAHFGPFCKICLTDADGN
jgi:hypothetical protein